VPLLLVAGALLLVPFSWWQQRVQRQPPVPPRLSRDRTFSVANVAISTVGFTITAMMFPFMLYAQVARDLSATGAALLLAPQAVVSIILAPIAGRLTDKVHPRALAVPGLLGLAVVTYLLTVVMTPDSSTWSILIVATFMGVSNSFIWGPLSASANRNLPMDLAGAGAGVYNTTRQMGSVLGSAAIAMLMEARISANLPGSPGAVVTPPDGAGAAIPPEVKAAFANALAQSMLLPAAVVIIGAVGALFFETPRHQRR